MNRAKVKSRTKRNLYLALLVIFFAILFFLLYVLSSLSGLRFFVPHYFSIAGGPFSEKNYLVLIQNNNKLNESGGELSAYGTLKFKNGLYSELNIYNLELEIEDHSDFTKTVFETLKKDQITSKNINFDGVFAINMKVFEDILRIVDQIKLEDKLLTDKNLSVLINSPPEGSFQDFLSKLVAKICYSPINWRQISDTLVENLNEKHIRLFFFNSSLQEKIDAKNWSGKWPTFKKDFIAVNVINLSETSSDNYIKRTVDYRIDTEALSSKSDGQITGDIIITLEHFGRDNPPLSENYTGKIRVYTSATSTIQDSNITFSEDKISDYLVLENQFNLKPGEQKKFRYTIVLPGILFSENSYHLDIVKQPGTLNDFYSVIVKTPPDLSIKSDSFIMSGEFAMWKWALRKDVSISLDFVNN